MITAHHLKKVYQTGEIRQEVIKDLSLEISEGEFISLVGPSGSGKSTVLNMLGCLDTPTNGEIVINNTSTTTMNRTQRANFRGENIGFIFQSFNLIPVLSVYENVEYPLIMIQNLPEEERKSRVLTLLEEVGMLDHKDKTPDKISGGQMQRVAIARALVTNPKIVFADEPTANLDTKTAHMIIELMKKIQREHQTTFVFATHDEKIVSNVDRLITLVDGEIVADQRMNK
ncbi:ABC transporter ATP-binding protein [Sulfurospirillum diekertiae]|uniref:ABC transporter ATP-binding protein YtrE n=1 Tax=Sulfurospirillum diekertiae TaxID=1854492 RepID=A0A1Y0HJE5_9BACT|nr:ABC transporter ATP-binding protein [Sulfurospirillum diekertiae]ARU48178.1 ABC transporter ATP-binding protein YtrE [Sulfurospirillum diekertiae]ASC93021.1 ABC transporter ATP-binding protein YtrE [Sulfurospirillum diekertiae]